MPILVLCWLILTSLILPTVWAEDTFLPVDEAMQLVVYTEADTLVWDWSIADGYYMYHDRLQLQADITLSPHQVSDNITRHYDETFDEVMAVHYHSLRMTVAQPNAPTTLQVTYQGCADEGLCYPPQRRSAHWDGQQFTLLTKTAPATQPPASQSVWASPHPLSAPDNLADTAYTTAKLISVLISAFIGGLLLNVMPCVFPVISLKALHFAQLGSASSAVLRNHGGLYTAGVLVSFMLVAAAVYGLRSVGIWVGWGFQLQSPYFVALMAYLFFAMGLLLLSEVALGSRLIGLGQSLTQGERPFASFFTGVLATVVATPCTVPFMVTAVTLALAQPGGIGLLLFAVMGLGMASPILVLSLMPHWHRYLPRPGAWMLRFKQALAFPLFATVIWLLWILVQQVGANGMAAIACGLLLLAWTIWLSHSRATGLNRLLRLSSLALAVGLLITVNTRTASIWQPYDAAKLQSMIAQGDAVLVNVDAAWCITCKANERLALSGERFDRLIQAQSIRLVNADWTHEDPQVTQFIQSFGRDGVPLYVFFPAHQGTPKILPQLLTPAIVERYLTGE